MTMAILFGVLLLIYFFLPMFPAANRPAWADRLLLCVLLGIAGWYSVGALLKG